MAYRLFISYSTKDLETVNKIESALTSPYMTFFVAERSVSPSESLNKKILPAIQKANLFLLLWSRNSQESPWVKKELEQAMAFNIPVYPVLLDEDAQLPAALGDTKYLAAHDDFAVALQKIQSQILARAKEKNNQELALLIGAGILLWAASK